MSRSLSSQLSAWDASIRIGEGKRVRRELQGLLRRARIEGRAAFERQDLARLAALCRRTGLAESGVRLLAPVVRPKARAVVRANAGEIAEYAASLINLGADREALNLLEGIKGEEHPSAWFFAALARFARWDYERALPLLERYLEHAKLSAYERQIGEVNWVAARVAVFDEETQAHLFHEIAEQLEVLLARTREEGQLLLHGNLLEIQAQLLIEHRDFARARSSLERSEELLKEIGSQDFLYVRKWSAVVEAFKAPRSRSGRDRLHRVRAEALASAQWETVRDCDFHLARALAFATNRASTVGPALQRRLDHLYFGTPHAPYRARVARLFAYEPSASYDWRVDESRPAPPLDPPLDPFHDPRLKAGQVPQRLLGVLASDFYRPHRLASLHAELFPDRHFSLETSPQVIHQAIKRLRAWLDAEGIPLAIEESQGSYRLLGPVSIRTSAEPVSADRAETQLRVWIKILAPLFRQTPTMSFQELAAHSPHATRTTHRLLARAVVEGLLVREGAGKRTRYRLPS